MDRRKLFTALFTGSGTALLAANSFTSDAIKINQEESIEVTDLPEFTLTENKDCFFIAAKQDTPLTIEQLRWARVNAKAKNKKEWKYTQLRSADTAFALFY